MVVQQDFTTKKLTLAFQSGKRIELDKMESREFQDWFERKRKEVENEADL